MSRTSSSTSSTQSTKAGAQPPGGRWKVSLQALILVLLIIPIVVVWQLYANRLNNTDPTVAGRPLSNPQIHLHTVALGGKPGVLYLGTHFGLFTSTDGGRSWPQPRGVLNKLMVTNIAVSSVNDQALAVIGRPNSGNGGQTGIYFSTDGGNDWQISHDPAGLPPMAYLFNVQAGTGGAGHFYAFYVFAGWFETRDMGAHWYPITQGALSNMQTPSLLTDPADPNHLLLGGEQGLYESRDDGKHWSQLTAVSGNVLNIVASRTEPRLIFCTTDQGIYRWQDGSTRPHITQLAHVPWPSSPSRLAVSADGHELYAITGQDLWYSANEGTSWRHQWQFERGDIVSLLINPLDAKQLYIGFFQPATVRVSPDSGTAWQTLTS